MEHPFYPWDFPDPTFPFAVQANPCQDDCPAHRHHFMEIVYIVAGSGTHIMDADASTIEAGDCFVIPIDSAHSYADTKALHIVNILFDNTLLAPFQHELNTLPGYHALCLLEPIYRRQYDSRGRLRPAPGERVAIIELIDRMLAESAAMAPGYRIKLLALFVQLLTDLARYYQQGVQKSSSMLVQLGAVISKIAQDYAQPLSVRELAEAANMSERNLNRRFREAVGMAPIAYLVRLRIRRAAQLLRDTSRPIGEIASLVGFDDSNYFSRQFTGIMGVSPREFRKTRFAHDGSSLREGV